MVIGKTLDAENHIIMPVLYAPILLPEMNPMYEEHGENVLGYVADSRIVNTMELIERAVEEIAMRGIEVEKDEPLVSGHGTLLNLLAYKIYGIEEILTIHLGTAEGFWVAPNKKIVLF